MDMKKIKFDFSWILLVVFIIFFIIWSILVLQGRFISFDYQIFDEIHHYLMNPFLISFFKIITQMGSATVLLGITLISLFLLKINILVLVWELIFFWFLSLIYF